MLKREKVITADYATGAVTMRLQLHYFGTNSTAYNILILSQHE